MRGSSLYDITSIKINREKRNTLVYVLAVISFNKPPGANNSPFLYEHAITISRIRKKSIHVMGIQNKN